MENNYFFESFDGKKIYIHEWTVENPVGIVQIFHGMAEHGGRYEGLANYLNTLGFVVVADDHRAHGKTDQETLGYCEGDIWEDTLKDLYGINKAYKSKYPNLKYIIFGHSYGSFLAQAYIQNYDGLKENLFDAVVLSGSAKMDTVAVKLGKILAKFGKPTDAAHTLKKMSFDAYNKKFKEGIFISGILAECDRYQADSFCNFVCSKNFYRCFFCGVLKTYKKANLAKLNKELPTLIISGAEDPVGDFGKSVTNLYEMYIKAGLRRVELCLVPDNRHEVLNDVGKEQALQIISNFAKSIL